MRVAPNKKLTIGSELTHEHAEAICYNFCNRSRDFPVHPQFEGVRHKFLVPPSVVGFASNRRKIEPDPVRRERLPIF
jgi:hypothetical protein